MGWARAGTAANAKAADKVAATKDTLSFRIVLPSVEWCHRTAGVQGKRGHASAACRFAGGKAGVTSRTVTLGSFPATRLRRTRAAAWSRALWPRRCLRLDLIWPLFIAEGRGVEEPIASLPGVSRWSVDRLAGKAREARDLGIPCVALFPNTPLELRTDDAREALNADNLICRAVKAVKEAVPEVGVLTDIALDPYTADGHDGLTNEAGYVLNDETSKILVEQSLVQAGAGADIVAPSD